ncbi:MAG: UvrB/UvrC motif-containing protein [Oscillospiraceae bacterium]|jgi:protein arginine kinase activator|nr:UvrB/UvrC motif-containing protein [Oscillospiraceae bacterium]
MLCENCGQQPATVHLTTIVGGDKTEQHLCAACCQKHKQALTMAGMSTLLLSLLQGAGSTQHEHVEMRCECCGQTYDEFQKTGMLGCPKCYDAFRSQLVSLLGRIHGGKTQHTGRIPPRSEEQNHAAKRLETLRRDMDRAVADEDFELAAKLRDEIRAMQPAREEEKHA